MTQKEYFNKRHRQYIHQSNSIERLSKLTGKGESLLNKIFNENLVKFGDEALASCLAYGGLNLWINRRGL